MTPQSGDWYLYQFFEDPSDPGSLVSRVELIRPAGQSGVFGFAWNPDLALQEARIITLSGGLEMDWGSSDLTIDRDQLGFATVATTGNYADLIGKPTIPSGQVNSDWAASSGVAQILNKPTFGTAAFQNITAFDPAGSAAAAQAFAIQRSNQSGTQPASTISDFSNAALAAVTWSTLTGKPTFATVATSGSYNDLTGRPTIPAAQVNSDWNAVSGVAQILNKPTIPTILPRSFSTPTFAGSTTATQPSVTRDALVSYGYDATNSITLIAGQTVTATLTYADNAGMTTNPVVVDACMAGNSGLLGLSQINTLQVRGVIPSGKYRRVTFATTGGAAAPSVLKAGQEVLL